ncbi:unnamed protein product [Penicillium salamii]|uniref:F-box domain-containing protein n=1 Tax=Penicillium salamii TaxID=1612424 RepID=A0A9W4NDX9_9EURO|nr:unnamed protein product [Penicillium salamii]CAG8234189.1 unnamed protein product [Penicillium salamii]CAG8276989.1 unnamed protein product [Penicillium salamii]CAG8298897.1 unnamed protein product [Penicillium salamii]CAG8349138.1 unnamed protein product [Penicillium salamii]
MDRLQQCADVTYLVFKLLEPKDLANICRVSSFCNAVASPLLYRSVTLGSEAILSEVRDNQLDNGWKWDFTTGICQHQLLLKCLLEFEANPNRELIRELIIDPGACTHRPSSACEFGENLSTFNRSTNPLNVLVRKLPNLKIIRFLNNDELVPPLLDVIANHPKKPIVHLLDAASTNQFSLPIPMVETANITVPRNNEAEDLDIHKLFVACPNLRDLSVTVIGFNTSDWFPMTIPKPYTSPRKILPPLRKLTLSGYPFQDSQISDWRDGFPWHSLRSLTLGPYDNQGIFDVIPSDLRLTELEINIWDPANGFGIDSFLLSFSTLETLRVDGHIPSIAAISSHPLLTALHLGRIGWQDECDVVFTPMEIAKLRRNCPSLVCLELNGKQH